MFDQKPLSMGLQLACAKIVARSDIESAGLLHPIDDLASSCQKQIKHIPPWRQRQFRDVAYDLSASRENIKRTPTTFARAVKHKLSQACIKRDMDIHSRNGLVIS